MTNNNLNEIGVTTNNSCSCFRCRFKKRVNDKDDYYSQEDYQRDFRI
jgi:hypothetical protein